MGATATYVAMETAQQLEDRFRYVRFSGVERPRRRSPRPPHAPRLPLRAPGAARNEQAPGAARQLDAVPDEAREFLCWLLQSAQLPVHHYRIEPLYRRLPACLRTLHATSVGQAREILTGQPKLLHAAVSAVVIGVTAFFRDAAVFEVLKTRILPELMRRRSGLRVWSAGCSDGAELYSVAILLDGLGALEGSELDGTDCRPDAVAQAREGWLAFEPSGEAGRDPRLAGYLDRSAIGSRLCEKVRCRTRWRQAELFAEHEEPLPGHWDMILCRNVAIYLQPDATAVLWRKLTRALRPGGVLVVGKAERPMVPGLRRIEPCIYGRMGENDDGVDGAIG